ncbi:MAG: hypothetical protein ACREBD_23795 [Blastocatellia bacterium]
MKKLSATLFTLFAVIGLLSISLTTAEAQGRYRGRSYSKADVDRIIKRVEERSDQFRKAVDRHLDRSRLDDTKAEDRINRQVKQLEEALDELRSEFDRQDRWQETRGNVQKVMRQSDEINVLMRNSRFGPAIENEWKLLRADLNRLAGIYNLPQLRA